MTFSIMAAVMLSFVIYAECLKYALYAQCQYGQCHYSDFRYSKWRCAVKVLKHAFSLTLMHVSLSIYP